MSYDCPELLKALHELEKLNYLAASELLIPLAEAGNPKAQCNLATLYQCGLGLETDAQKAIELYTAVAERKIREEGLSAVAYNNLATIYLTGLPSLKRNPQKAQEYLEKAKELGFYM